MQVAGIIPKTERKTKASIAKNDSNSGSVPNKADVNNSSSNSSSNSAKKDPNAVFKFEEDSSEIQWIPKGGSINGIVNGGKTIISKGKDLQTLLSKELNGGAKNGIVFYNGLNTIGKKIDSKNGKVIQNNSSQISAETSGKGGKSRQTYSKKNVAAKNNFANGVQPKKTVDASLNVNGRSKDLENDKSRNKIGTTELKDSSVVPPPCGSEQKLLFEELRTLKSVEVSVGERGTNAECNGTLNRSVEDVKDRTVVPTSIPTNFTINNQDIKPNLVLRNGIISTINKNDSLNGGLDALPWKLPNVCRNDNGETRQQFLTRVRQAFKSQYLKIKNASVESEKNEKLWKRALRDTLRKCVVTNPSFCAHFLVENEPIKYSSNSGSETKECSLLSGKSINNLKSSVVVTQPVKHKRTASKNGTSTLTRKGNKCDTVSGKGKVTNGLYSSRKQNGVQSNFSSDSNELDDSLDGKTISSDSLPGKLLAKVLVRSLTHEFH
jgi:hypothetical protein